MRLDEEDIAKLDRLSQTFLRKFRECCEASPTEIGGQFSQIYAMTASGTSQRPITDDQAYDSGPTLSRDGTTLLFTSTRGGSAGNTEIWIQPSGSSAANVTDAPSIYDSDPRWLPVP